MKRIRRETVFQKRIDFFGELPEIKEWIAIKHSYHENDNLRITELFDPEGKLLEKHFSRGEKTKVIYYDEKNEAKGSALSVSLSGDNWYGYKSIDSEGNRESVITRWIAGEDEKPSAFLNYINGKLDNYEKISLSRNKKSKITRTIKEGKVLSVEIKRRLSPSVLVKIRRTESGVVKKKCLRRIDGEIKHLTILYLDSRNKVLRRKEIEKDIKGRYLEKRIYNGAGDPVYLMKFYYFDSTNELSSIEEVRYRKGKVIREDIYRYVYQYCTPKN